MRRRVSSLARETPLRGFSRVEREARHFDTGIRRGAVASWLVILGLVGVGLASAHDMWLQPTRFDPAVGELVGVGLWIGHAAEGEGFPRREDHMTRFEVQVGDEVFPLPGQPGLAPAGYLKPSMPGLHTVVYESRGTVSELSAERFDAYLVEEGLEAIRVWRCGHGEANQPGREQYRRSLKSLVRVGATSRDAEDRAVGLPLELVLESPSGAEPAVVAARLLWHGEALPDALVELQSLDTMGTDTRAARTDAEGRVIWASVEAGNWMLATVHMERASSRNEGWEWRTTFATLTFASGVSTERGQ